MPKHVPTPNPKHESKRFELWVQFEPWVLVQFWLVFDLEVWGQFWFWRFGVRVQSFQVFRMWRAQYCLLSPIVKTNTQNVNWPKSQNSQTQFGPKTQRFGTDTSLYTFCYDPVLFTSVKIKEPSFVMLQVSVYLEIQLSWTALKELSLSKNTLILSGSLGFLTRIWRSSLDWDREMKQFEQYRANSLLFIVCSF